jgi:hypothetical protein
MEKKGMIKKVVSSEGYVPRVYYVGMGKTASSSLCAGFNPNAVQWHSDHYVDQKYNTRFLIDNKLDLYDLVFLMGKEYKFIPLIIESCREPISHSISWAFQHMKRQRMLPYTNTPCPCELCKWKNNNIDDVQAMFSAIRNHVLELKTSPRIPYSAARWKKHFNVDLLNAFSPSDKHCYYYSNVASLLMLRYEDIELRPRIFNKLGYKFKSLKLNKTKQSSQFAAGKYYNTIFENLSKLELSSDDLVEIYSSKYVTSFYSSDEIELFMGRFAEKK